MPAPLRIRHRIHLRMRRPRALVKTFADNFPRTHQHGPDSRIRERYPEPSAANSNARRMNRKSAFDEKERASIEAR